MRLIIDLASPSGAIAPGKLSIAQQLAKSAGANEVWIAVSSSGDTTPERTRALFAPYLARERVIVYDVVAGGTSWRNAAAAAIRENFFAALNPDLVLSPEALSQLDADADLWAQCVAATRPAPPARARLAYVSPLPPQHSGIADYSAELVPELARYYDVELIVDQPEVDSTALAGHVVRDLAWFEEHGADYDRVLYHFGNSGVHRHMFGLIARHPGVVVLHDFYLSGVLDNLENDGYLPQGFLRAMFVSHGYTGLSDLKKIGRNPAIWKYPLNKDVLDAATGVIVHSEFSKRLARQWYGEEAADSWRTVPLLRGLHTASERGAARERLGLNEDDYLVCSFGMLGRIKLNEELLDAFLASPLATSAKLVFVGENDAGPYGAGIARKVAESGARIEVTGFVDAARYADYAAACDCAVQLRTNTRGETSAAVLDCLLHGAPTIVNAHGAIAEIDDAVLLKIADPVRVADLTEALTRMHADPALRAQYARQARSYMAAQHAPAQAGRAVTDAIEAIYAASPRQRYAELMATMAALPGEPSERDLTDCARAIAHNQPPTMPRQLLVDISALVQSDLRTGIQRVVRSVLLAMIAEPPAGYRIEPVYSHGGNRGYLYARRFALEMIGEGALQLEDAPVELRRGDLFLGLDLFTNGTVQNEASLMAMRQRGVGICFVVYDLLPVLRPECFPFGTERYFSEFLGTISKVADGLLCISRAVADELHAWLGEHGARRQAPLNIGYFHLGADIDASAPSTGLPPNAQQVFDAAGARPSFLMVGTVEPRKGQAQALAAMELLWAQGVDVNLVIVGKQGWMVDDLAARMAAHPEKERRLFWLAGVSDEMLLALYGRCSALLAPSEGEGFGLPLIEAAQHGIPIVARDIPVFREVAGEHARYFDGHAASDLAAALALWLDLHRAGKAPGSSAMPWLTWRQSAQQAVDALVHQRWYRQLHTD